MQFDVLQDQFQRALRIVSPAVDSRAVLPVLANVLLETESARLKISATNLEMSITTYIGAKIDVPGAITLPAKTLSDVVAKFSPERVSCKVDMDTQSMKLRCGTATSVIKGIAATEYPPVPVLEDATIEIEAAQFKRMLKETTYCTASEDNRPILTGVYMEIEGDAISLAAADGYRLAIRAGKLLEETNFHRPIRIVHLYKPDERELAVGKVLSEDVINYKSGNDVTRTTLARHGDTITLDLIERCEAAEIGSLNIAPHWTTPIHIDPVVVIPRATMEAVERLLPKEGTVGITLPGERDLVCFSFDGVTVISQILEGKFPDFGALLPKSCSTSVTVYTSDLLRAAQRAEIFAKDSNYSARLFIDTSKGPGEPGTFLITGKSAERGENEGLIDAQVEGDALEVAVNVAYLVQFLGTFPDERVVLESLGASHPLVLHPEGRKNYTHVVMPMSINR